MLWKGIILVWLSTSVVVLAFLLYQPLPDGIEDRYRVHVVQKLFAIIDVVLGVGEYLGFGTYYQLFVKIQNFELIREPVTASYGDLKVTKEIIAGVPVIIYQPLDNSVLYPAIIYYHGGGWTICGPDVYDKTAYDYANQTRTVVFNVGYRLAPQHPFPTPFQDSLDVTTFVLRHGAKYNVDVTKVGVAGDSAGGNLAAAVTLKLFKEKNDLPPLLFQVLHYPALQALDLHLPSYIEYNTTMPLLPQVTMAAYYAFYMGLDVENIAHYVKVISENRHVPPHVRKSKYLDVKLLPKEYQTPREISQDVTTYDEKVYDKIKDVITNPLFSPLMAPDLTGLPPAFIHICEFDVLRDDAFLYARRLQDAGVKVQVYFGKGGFHADIMKLDVDFLQSSSGKKALAAAYAFIRDILQQ